jgi:hypothetical protein
VVAPPLKIENVSTALLLQPHMAADPAIVWLRNILSEIYSEFQLKKAEIINARSL